MGYQPNDPEEDRCPPPPPPGIDPTADPSPLYSEALHDQAAVEVRGKARVIAAFHSELLTAGMGEFDALELTREFQRDFLAPLREARERLQDERADDEDEAEPGA